MSQMTGFAIDRTAMPERHLTRAEDDDLRRLTWLSQIGVLSSCKRRCLIDLLIRDRRQEVRAPREFQVL